MAGAEVVLVDGMISEADIKASQQKLCRMEGIFPAPEGTDRLVALEKLVQQNWILPGERIVLFNTGPGLKYLDQLD
jgi:threonine synthase